MSGADEGWEEVPPDPAATIESLRALGYSPGSAIADLIDNSIAKGARTVEVRFHWAGAESWCAVVDDGVGMTDEGLRQAMRIGSGDPLADRGPSDLGRFGFGLKTASFSQCREVTVESRTVEARTPHVRCWDLDHVREVGKWDLRRSAPSGAGPLLRSLRPAKHGTVVLWRRLDDLVEAEAGPDDEAAQSHFLSHVRQVEEHLAMTFWRFLSRPRRPLELLLNGHRVAGWDPFLTDKDATQQLSTERLSLKGRPVRVDAYVLPHRSKLTDAEYERAGGPKGWNGQQGFYVYRQDRLIVAGDWLGLGFTRDDTHNLARIAVDVPSSLDKEWRLDITKGVVRPPAGLREELRRIAKETRRRASAVLHHRGAPVGPRPQRSVVPVWHQRRKHGEILFRINRDHPLIASLVRTATGSQTSDVLRLIEETVPIVALPASAAPTERRAYEGRPPDEVVELASRLYESLLKNGLTRKEAADRVMTCQPFNEYPDLMSTVWGEIP